MSITYMNFIIDPINENTLMPYYEKYRNKGHNGFKRRYTFKELGFDTPEHISLIKEILHKENDPNDFLQFAINGKTSEMEMYFSGYSYFYTNLIKCSDEIHIYNTHISFYKNGIHLTNVYNRNGNNNADLFRTTKIFFKYYNHNNNEDILIEAFEKSEIVDKGRILGTLKKDNTRIPKTRVEVANIDKKLFDNGELSGDTLILLDSENELKYHINLVDNFKNMKITQHLAKSHFTYEFISNFPNWFECRKEYVNSPLIIKIVR